MYIYIYIYIRSLRSSFGLSCADKLSKNEKAAVQRLILCYTT